MPLLKGNLPLMRQDIDQSTGSLSKHPRIPVRPPISTPANTRVHFAPRAMIETCWTALNASDLSGFHDTLINAAKTQYHLGALFTELYVRCYDRCEHRFFSTHGTLSLWRQAFELPAADTDALYLFMLAFDALFRETHDKAAIPFLKIKPPKTDSTPDYLLRQYIQESDERCALGAAHALFEKSGLPALCDTLLQSAIEHTHVSPLMLLHIGNALFILKAIGAARWPYVLYPVIRALIHHNHASQPNELSRFLIACEPHNCARARVVANTIDTDPERIDDTAVLDFAHQFLRSQSGDCGQSFADLACRFSSPTILHGLRLIACYQIIDHTMMEKKWGAGHPRLSTPDVITPYLLLNCASRLLQNKISNPKLLMCAAHLLEKNRRTLSSQCAHLWERTHSTNLCASRNIDALYQHVLHNYYLHEPGASYALAFLSAVKNELPQLGLFAGIHLKAAELLAYTREETINEKKNMIVALKKAIYSARPSGAKPH